MKKFAFLILSAVFMSFSGFSQESIYDFKVETIDGEEFNFSDYKGYKILIINTASKCGFTPQYEQLEEIYKDFKDQKFIIVGFPSNDFMKQEPGTNEEIAEFCQKNYGVTFPMMAKVSVKGSEQCDLFNFLTDSERNGASSQEVKWNFQKFLIGRDGQLEMVISPKIKPTDAEITNWISAN
jgi:glutathione peroxidase|tara:strand:- start:10401 stop:10943 length:543 start_codon:yes stop_codon:yes gene_type:complete